MFSGAFAESIIFLEKKVLDIGCLYGQFLIHFPNGSLGVDIQDYAINFARSLGLKVIKCNVEDHISVEDGSYDVVFASQIIEHMVSPHKLMREIHRILVSEGVVIISVPNMDVITLSNWPGYKFSEHLYTFNVKSLIFLLERSGFKVINTFHPSRKLHIPNIFLQKVQFSLLRFGSVFFTIAQKDDNFKYSRKRLDYFFPSWMPKDQR